MSAPAVPAARRSAWSWPRVLWLVGSILLLTLVAHLVIIAVTGAPVTGPVSLRKAATFAETGWLLAWSTALILPAIRTRPWQRHLIGASVALFGIVETTVIGIQAWRGVPSHYNFTTLLDTVLLRAGAAGAAAVFLVGMLVLLVATIRSSTTPHDLRLGILAGVIVTLVGALVGFAMVSNNSGVYQGALGVGFGRTGGYFGPTPATVGPDYLGLRPATLGGDLVLPHAVGVHGLVLLAVPAVLALRAGLTERLRLRLAAAGAAAVTIAMTTLLAHALRQQPLRELGVPALIVLGLCAATLAACVAAAVLPLLRKRDTPCA